MVVFGFVIFGGFDEIVRCEWIIIGWVVDVIFEFGFMIVVVVNVRDNLGRVWLLLFGFGVVVFGVGRLRGSLDMVLFECSMCGSCIGLVFFKIWMFFDMIIFYVWGL